MAKNCEVTFEILPTKWFLKLIIVFEFGMRPLGFSFVLLLTVEIVLVYWDWPHRALDTVFPQIVSAETILF